MRLHEVNDDAFVFECLVGFECRVENGFRTDASDLFIDFALPEFDDSMKITTHDE